MNLDRLMIHNRLTSVEMMKLLGLDPDFRGTSVLTDLFIDFVFSIPVLQWKWLDIVTQ